MVPYLLQISWVELPAPDRLDTARTYSTENTWMARLIMGLMHFTTCTFDCGDSGTDRIAFPFKLRSLVSLPDFIGWNWIMGHQRTS